MKCLIRSLCVVLCLFATEAFATHEYPSIHFRGFGTAALGGTDTDRLGFRLANNQRNGLTSRWGFDTDSRLGLQLDVDFDRSWHAGMQWVARNHVGDFFEQNLDWAYLRWRPQEQLDVRLGRLGLDMYFLSEYRNVGYAYPWMRAPHEFYGNAAVYHFDGGDIARRFKLGDGYLTVKAFGGYAYFQLPIYQSGVLSSGLFLGGGTLAFEQGNWRARIAHMYAEQSQQMPIGPLTDALNQSSMRVAWPGANTLPSRLKVAGKAIQFSTIGFSYDDGTWLAQLEGAYTNSNMEVIPDIAVGYFSVGRRFDEVTLYTVYGIGHSLHRRVALPAIRYPSDQLNFLQSQVDSAFNGNGMDEQSLSAGVRWDVYRNVAVKAEWSHHWLGTNGVLLWDVPGYGQTPDNVNVWTVGVDFVF